jgi:hypothetical protein
MSTVSTLAAGLCVVAMLGAAAAERPRDDGAAETCAAPVRLVGENCPRVAPPCGRIERDTIAIDERAGLPRNVCLVFFEADADDPRR